MGGSSGGGGSVQTATPWNNQNIAPGGGYSSGSNPWANQQQSRPQFGGGYGQGAYNDLAQDMSYGHIGQNSFGGAQSPYGGQAGQQSGGKGGGRLDQMAQHQGGAAGMFGGATTGQGSLPPGMQNHPTRPPDYTTSLYPQMGRPEYGGHPTRPPETFPGGPGGSGPYVPTDETGAPIYPGGPTNGGGYLGGPTHGGGLGSGGPAPLGKPPTGPFPPGDPRNEDPNAGGIVPPDHWSQTDTHRSDQLLSQQQGLQSAQQALQQALQGGGGGGVLGAPSFGQTVPGQTRGGPQYGGMGGMQGGGKGGGMPQQGNGGFFGYNPVGAGQMASSQWMGPQPIMGNIPGRGSSWGGGGGGGWGGMGRNVRMY